MKRKAEEAEEAEEEEEEVRRNEGGGGRETVCIVTYVASLHLRLGKSSSLQHFTSANSF